ncbi:MAG: hypothetical protein EXR98_01660 [Gemmataceae bacterium]|nr:hypothetical protein [Gemmataceae bacterium]
MSEPAKSTLTPPKITVRHYQALCGLALAAILLLLFQQSSRSILNPAVTTFIHVMILLIGVVGILYPVRLSPMLVLFGIAAPMALEQFYSNRALGPDLRAGRILDLADMLMCMAGLVFFVGYYRLHGLWFGVLPADRRQPSGMSGPPKRRSEDSLSLAELAPLVITVPAFALLAEFACMVLKLRWTVVDLPPQWQQGQQLLLAAWTILLGLTVGAQSFRYWRRVQMDRTTALLMLQDVLWNETRGEQRRLQRWLAWRRLREKKS